MIKSIEITGKTEEEALSKALSQLGMERDEVSVEILERAKSGFLGIGGSPARIRVSYEYQESKTEQVASFLEGLFRHMGVQASAEITETETGISVNLIGENIGALIGRRGETLDAIQHLANYSVNRGGERTRICIDAENYRAKRTEALEHLAQKVAGKVVKQRRNVTLEPMNAYERHVIHTALQNFSGVTTYSTGTEPNRRVVVAYERSGGRSSGDYASSRRNSPSAPAAETQPVFQAESKYPSREWN